MIHWNCKKFDELTPAELYAILQLRNEVFVVEQNCVFQDADDKDQYCYHLMGWKDNRLAAYTRLVPPGISYKEMSIGRVVTASTARGGGIGKLLMEVSIKKCRELFGEGPIKIGAQCYLEKFYTNIGFVKSGDMYMEDNIPHIEMFLS